jgi:uncharacterized ferritin-like protein (DUF455 family)
MTISSIFQAALNCIQESNPNLKLALTNEFKSLWLENKLYLESTPEIIKIIAPGLPDTLSLVLPRDLPKRKLHHTDGKAALLHAIAHIEFNAINLAWDAIYRFQNMPKEYYTDWLQIAAEEAKHFSLLNEYLNDLGYQYGDFPAHNSLWELAVETDYDVLVRMALVPRIMEARGLDVTPGMIKKFEQIGDSRAVAILNLILSEEQGHVFIGNKWFNALCKDRQLEPLTTFRELISKHVKGQIKPPFAKAYRIAAGFTEIELAMLEEISKVVSNNG